MKDGKLERRLSPSLFDVASVCWAWMRCRWNLLWLIPDVALFSAVIVLMAAYLPKTAGLVAGAGHEEWIRRITSAATTGILSAALVFAFWHGLKRLWRYGWRSRPMSLLSITKTSALVAVVVSFHYGGATQLLGEELRFPTVSTEAAINSICGLPAAPTTPSSPLKDMDVATPVTEATYRELTNTTDKRVFLARLFQRIESRYSWIRLVSKLYNLPTSLVAAVMVAESGLNDMAISPMGAKGLMQLMPVNYTSHDPFDPVTNVELGAQLLRHLIDEHGDVAPALAHYNASNRANKQAQMLAETLGANDFWLRREFLPEETRNYVPRVLAMQIAWEDWQKHGRVRSFEERHGLTPAKEIATPRPPAKTQEGRQYIVRRGDTAFAIARRTGVSTEELKRLNAGLNPKRLIIGQVLRLPSNS